METILIATDFSSAARNATIYGFELARSLRAKVILFTAYLPSLALPDSVLYVPPHELEKNSYKLLADEAQAIDPEKTVELEIKSLQGAATSSILLAASRNNVSYIIVGMKERGKEIRKYFGSTVTHLYKESTLPLIVIPADVVFSDPATIALASDLTDSSDFHVLDPLKVIAENFDSRLFIVRVIKKPSDYDNDDEIMRSERLSWFLTNVEHHFEFIKAENVAKGLNTFVEQRDVNMLAVIPHEHTLFEKIFTGSVTKNLIFKSQVPLLILPERNTALNEVEAADRDSAAFMLGID